MKKKKSIPLVETDWSLYGRNPYEYKISDLVYCKRLGIITEVMDVAEEIVYPEITQFIGIYNDKQPINNISYVELNDVILLKVNDENKTIN